MKTTESKVQHWIEESAQLKEMVIARLSEMSETSKHSASSKNEWSAREVVEHLILVEEQIAGSWREALEKNQSAPSLKSGVLAAAVSAVFARTNIRTPTVPELLPRGGLTVDELSLRWEKARQELVATLPENTKIAWLRHPVFGSLNSNQMGKILVSHLKHHIRHWPKNR